MDLWLTTAVILLLVLCSAFFSAAETAFSSASRVRLKHLADNGSKKAKRALTIIDRYDKALSTILVGNNIVNIAASALATVLFVSFFGDAVGTLVSTITITIVVLICGEVLPKNYAIENSESICMKTGAVLSFLMWLLTPLTFLLLKIKDAFTHAVSKNKSKAPTVTEDELKYIVESIEEEGVLEEQESELVQSALEFDEKTAYDILTPRVDLVAIEAEEDLNEVLSVILSERYTRIPVYEGNVDNVIGVLHTRDFLEKMLEKQPFSLRDLLSPAYFIYRSKKLSALLADFKYKRLHLAVVTDDYGGTLGIVTMEDLLEQLVGDIWDEDEEVEHKYRLLSENCYELSGDMDLDDLLELLDRDDSFISTDSKSVGGWVIEQFGNIPKAEEQFSYRDLKVIVQEVEDNRVLKIRLEIQAPSPPEKA